MLDMYFVCSREDGVPLYLVNHEHIVVREFGDCILVCFPNVSDAARKKAEILWDENEIEVLTYEEHL